MAQKVVIMESVRGIVEYVLKSGSLDDRFMSIRRAMEGTIAHGRLQKDNENIYENYQKEVKNIKKNKGKGDNHAGNKY